MLTYATRQTVKDNRAKVSPSQEAGDEFSMAAIANLLEEHRQALSTDFKASISTLKAKPDHVHTTVSDHAKKISSLEANANLQDERLLTLESSCATLTENNAKLLAKVSDLESRSRRNNIRVVGKPESVEGPWPTTFFAELLMEVFGEGLEWNHCQNVTELIVRYLRNRSRGREHGQSLSGCTGTRRKRESYAKSEPGGASYSTEAPPSPPTKTMLWRW